MAQWFNKDFFFNINLILNGKLVIPRKQYKYLCDINILELKNNNIKACILDVNQTLIAYDESYIQPELIDFVRKLKNDFKVCALSNYAGTTSDDRSGKRADLVTSKFSIPVVNIEHRKPAKEAFEKAISYLKVKPQNCAFVGDRIFTDIIGSNLSGMFSILVDPLIKKNDPLYVSIPRFIESIALRFHLFVRNNWRLNGTQ